MFRLKNQHIKLLTMTFASILLTTLLLSTNNAFAMGSAPSTCQNRYDGPIVSFLINNGSQTFDPIANPGITFNVNRYSSYNVTFVIQTPSTSSQGNSLSGTTWYDTSAPGYFLGQCVGGAGPNQNVTVSRSQMHPGNFGNEGIQEVQFNTLTYGGVTFNVNWLPAIPTVPQSPTNLATTAISSSQINLGWVAPANNGGALVTGYMIERSTDNGSTWSTIVLNTFSTNTTYSDTGLAHSTTYTYSVSAINSVGTSSPSNTASATTLNTVPTPPTNLATTAISSSQINLRWNPPGDNGGTQVTGYGIERSTNGGSTWSILVSNTGNTNTTYSDTGLSPNTTYTYRVSAINSVGTSDPSNIASSTTPLLSAAGITVGPVNTQPLH